MQYIIYICARADISAGIIDWLRFNDRVQRDYQYTIMYYRATTMIETNNKNSIMINVYRYAYVVVNIKLSGSDTATSAGR